MKNNRANKAVSDIVGTVLLLGMTIALFSVLCVGVLSYPSSPSEPAVNLVGTIIETPDDAVYLLLEHCGGEALDLDTKVIITIDDDPDEFIIGDGDYLTEEDKIDNKWSIGEGLVYPIDGGIDEKQVKITVVDTKSNSVIMLGSLKGT